MNLRYLGRNVPVYAFAQSKSIKAMILTESTFMPTRMRVIDHFENSKYTKYVDVLLESYGLRSVFLLLPTN